jgi:hypothetical protein
MSNRNRAKKRRRTTAVALLLAVAALAGCGGSKTTSTTTTAPAAPNPANAMRALIVKEPALAGKVQTLFESSGWALVQSTAPGKANAVVFRLIGSRWVPDRTGSVKLSILGPQPGALATTTPQLAIQFTGKTPFVESAIWVDGTEIPVNGAGSPRRGTIYGQPASKLKVGEHFAVGYARTALTGSAVAWVFKSG